MFTSVGKLAQLYELRDPSRVSTVHVWAVDQAVLGLLLCEVHGDTLLQHHLLGILPNDQIGPIQLLSCQYMCSAPRLVLGNLPAATSAYVL